MSVQEGVEGIEGDRLPREGDGALRDQLRELTLLHHLSTDIVQAHGLEDIYERSLEAVLEVLHANRAAVLLFDDDGVMRFKASRGLSDAYRQAVEGHSPWTPEGPSPEPFQISDAVVDTTLGPYREVVLGEGIHALAFIPLTYEGRLLGKFMAYFDAPHVLTGDELRLVQTVGNHVAFAIARKRAEAEEKRLRAQVEAERARLQTVLRHMPVGVVIADAPDGRLVMGNAEARRIWRLPDSLALEEDAEVFRTYGGFHPDGRPHTREECPLMVALETGEAVLGKEIMIARADGTRGTILVSTAPIREVQEGPAEAGVMIIEDVTERKRTEQVMRAIADAAALLAESLEYETTLHRVAGLMVPTFADWCVFDLLEEDGTLELVAVVHPDPEKIELARDMRRRYPPKPDDSNLIIRSLRLQQPILVEQMDDALLEQAAWDEEHLHLLRSLSLKSIITVPLVARGRALGALTLVLAESVRHYTSTDLAPIEELAHTCALALDNARLYRGAHQEIVDRKRAEAQLKELNETLEQRVAERTAALEGLNQQLREEVAERTRTERTLERTNLALVQSNRELQEFAYVASHDLQEPLRKISTFADLLGQDYKDRLDDDGVGYIQRMQDAAMRMSGLIHDLLAFSRVQTRGQSFEACDLGAVVEGVLSDLEVGIREAGAVVTVGALPMLEADPTQMRQLFQNLIGNALKFQREGMPPEITVAEESAPTGHCAVAVRDNGIGFSDKHAHRIFSPFQRLHGRGTYPGTGMGLAICRRIVERHCGTIAAHGTPDAGAAFIVTLPRRQEEHEE